MFFFYQRSIRIQKYNEEYELESIKRSKRICRFGLSEYRMNMK